MHHRDEDVAKIASTVDEAVHVHGGRGHGEGRVYGKQDCGRCRVQRPLPETTSTTDGMTASSTTSSHTPFTASGTSSRPPPVPLARPSSVPTSQPPTVPLSSPLPRSTSQPPPVPPPQLLRSYPVPHPKSPLMLN